MDTEFPQDSIGKIIKGPTGTSVQLVVLRNGKRLSLTATREDVSVNSVDVFYMVNETIGYIAISEFTNHTYRNFMLALTDLQKKGMKSLILDLRGNSGGILDEAIDIADEFIAGDRLITYTEGRKSPRKEYRCKRPGLFESGKLTVLCDDGSASASEVILGALQDWKRATIVGGNSFGKGLVQEQYELTNGGGVRLTIARYFTPKGRSIQRPYQHKSIEEYYAQENTVDTASTKKSSTLFGIQPDIAVSSASNDSYGNTLVFYPTLPSHLSHFALRWTIAHPDLKNTYPSSAAFLSRFKITNEIWSSLMTFLVGRTPLTSQHYDEERNEIEHQLKVYFALHLWQELGQRMVLNATDPVFPKALEAFN
ncbi:MAG: S41 family peptidase [Ferruginibacter sp.]